MLSHHSYQIFFVLFYCIYFILILILCNSPAIFTVLHIGLLYIA